MGYMALCIKCNYLVWAKEKKILILLIQKHKYRHKSSFFVIRKVPNDKIMLLEENRHDKLFWEGFNSKPII